MSGGILDGFQTIIPTAAAVLSERRQMLRMTQQEVADTERVRIEESGTKTDVTRLISARMATEFERGLYYGKNE